MSELEQLIPRFDQAFDALERGELDEFTRIVRDQTHPECDFYSGIGSAVGGGSYRGVEGLRDWFGDLIESTSERHWRNRRYETHGEMMLVYFADFDFIGAASGAPIEGETAAVFELEDGICVRINSFTSHAEAREFAEARVA
jgi:ketosteroid isomerase-like protein